MSDRNEVEENPVEELVPQKQYVHYALGLDGHLQLIQRPLSFWGKIELFSVLGTVIQKALESGLTLEKILEDVPDVSDIKDGEEFADADQFIKALATVAQFAPDFLKDLYVISLNVPAGEREYVKLVMSMPAEDGGLTDEQGIQILETFIEQNWDVLVDFFTKKILPLFNRLTNQAPESQSSKPSKATRQRTPKQ